MKAFVAVVLTVVLAGSGCMSQAQKQKTHSTAGSKFLGAALLTIIGGAIIIKVQADDENKYNTDKLFTGIGTVFVIAGVAGMVVYGAAWAATTPDPPPQPLPQQPSPPPPYQPAPSPPYQPPYAPPYPQPAPPPEPAPPPAS